MMNKFKKEVRNAISESDRPTNITRRDFLKFGLLTVAAVATLGTAAFAKEDPTSQVRLSDSGVSNKKTEKNKSKYNLVVDAPSNCFVGDAILLSVVDSTGKMVQGEKVEVTEPRGNKFTISIDNPQNGFVVRKTGEYLIEYGGNRFSVMVKIMNKELAGLYSVSVAEVRPLVEKTSHLYKYKMNGTNIDVLGADGSHIITTDITNFQKLKLKLDGMMLKDLIICADTGINPSYGGAFLQILILAASPQKPIERNTLVHTVVIGFNKNGDVKTFGPDVWILK